MAPFPADLFQWSGHRSGGVRRLFQNGSGRPSGMIVKTPLIERLQQWVIDIADHRYETPNIVLLVGGPGNGKTEAVETIISSLDERLRLDGELVGRFAEKFSPSMGNTVPRLAEVDVGSLLKSNRALTLRIVQDASVADPSHPTRPYPALLVDDLSSSDLDKSSTVYIACVNRGVLDDALACASDGGSPEVRILLQSVIEAVGLSPAAPSCWPLHNHPRVAVWPMDVESLLAGSTGISSSPAKQILDAATKSDMWPELEACAAGKDCPYCRSRELLSSDEEAAAFLSILRHYEIATGKRWSFRDLFSLISFGLAGSPDAEKGTPMSPCERALRLLQIDGKKVSASDPVRCTAIFRLVSAQYQHALFGRWARPRGKGIRGYLKELNIEDDATLLGLHYFLSTAKNLSVPATLEPQLAELAETLDPAFADPDQDLQISGNTTIKFRDIDSRFSHSVKEGFHYIRKYKCLSPLESQLLDRLADADDLLSSAAVRRRRPAVASRLQFFLRDFACRLVRRSLGARHGAVRGWETLSNFEKIMAGDQALIHDAVKQVESLMNDGDQFGVSLNTTFGEPLPPAMRRAVLTTSKQKVRMPSAEFINRPAPPIRFLSVGALGSTQFVSLTYELFSSVSDLRKGLLGASLPRTALALLDTTRARLGGRVVRDEDLLEGSEIRIGLRNEAIVRELGRFLVRKDESE